MIHLLFTLNDERFNFKKLRFVKSVAYIKKQLKDFNLEVFLTGLDFDEILGYFDLDELFKGLESLLEDVGFDRTLKSFRMDKIFNDMGLIVNGFTELLRSVDLESFVREVVGLLSKSLDFKNIQLFWKNLMEGAFFFIIYP